MIVTLYISLSSSIAVHVLSFFHYFHLRFELTVWLSLNLTIHLLCCMAFILPTHFCHFYFHCHNLIFVTLVLTLVHEPCLNIMPNTMAIVFQPPWRAGWNTIPKLVGVLFFVIVSMSLNTTVVVKQLWQHEGHEGHEGCIHVTWTILALVLKM